MFYLPISRHSLLKKRIDHSGNLPLFSSLRLQAELTVCKQSKAILPPIFCHFLLFCFPFTFSFHFHFPFILLSLSLSCYPWLWFFVLSFLPLAFIHTYGSIYTIEPPGWADLSCPIPSYYLCWHSLSLCPQLL